LYIFSPKKWTFCGNERLLYFADRGGESLLVLGDFPVAVQGWRKDAENGHLHAVGHPAKSREQRQLDLELAEAKSIHSLRHRIRLYFQNKKSIN